MNKGDAILRLLSEVKLELKEVKEQMEQIQTKLDTLEQQNQVKNKVERKKPKAKINLDIKDKRDWKYPAKMK
ncbi:hypothetical protein [Bacillus toyonensis]|uniref:hypothetical protein n=1 Tax=Bacillus toyonensis TaxID=155322 RepID=UPI000BF17691|nr:hypothetical protein [Bacillus toyonensis]PEK76187.1 hypothetical protein CN594_28885 [Bacillus toyonensis]PFY30930.1 hypothetical protein COL54_32740 [Bacillus toyonensis]PFY40870.1 hypothetical protein COL55_23885 [Bacillus toyonensis]PFY58418.1 hypothetical protein COL62_33345 [Bacillus toyonensis]PGD01742.1 hypothetical protein COM37_33925 [Bacillus toyonensis]